MLLKPKQVSDRLNVSLSTVYGLVESGRLGCHRIGQGRGAIRVSEDDLRAYLQSCHSGVPAATAPRPRRRRLNHIRL